MPDMTYEDQNCPRCNSIGDLIRVYDEDTAVWGYECVACGLRLKDCDLPDEPTITPEEMAEWPKTAADYDIVNEMLDEAAIADLCEAVRR